MSAEFIAKAGFIFVSALLAVLIADLLWSMTAGGRAGLSDTIIGYRIWRF